MQSVALGWTRRRCARGPGVVRIEKFDGVMKLPHLKQPNTAQAAVTTLYLVFRDPGRSWVPGLPTREQPQWDQHAVFMDPLFDAGRIVLAGPYADYSRELLVMDACDREEVLELLRDDPWTTSGVLANPKVIAWTVYMDSQQNHP